MVGVDKGGPMADQFLKAPVLCPQLGGDLRAANLTGNQRARPPSGRKPPSGPTRLDTCSGGSTGRSRVRHGCQPSSSGMPDCRRLRTPASAKGELTRSMCAVIRPRLARSRIPAEVAGPMPKSSAMTINLRGKFTSSPVGSRQRYAARRPVPAGERWAAGRPSSDGGSSRVPEGCGAGSGGRPWWRHALQSALLRAPWQWPDLASGTPSTFRNRSRSRPARRCGRIRFTARAPKPFKPNWYRCVKGSKLRTKVENAKALQVAAVGVTL